jgi:uncharacterized membrane protein
MVVTLTPSHVFALAESKNGEETLSRLVGLVTVGFAIVGKVEIINNENATKSLLVKVT